MLYKYSEFIFEGSKDHPTYIYWNNENYKKILENDWTEISVKKYAGRDQYEINFRVGSDIYDFYAVLLELNGKEELYLLEDDISPETFKQKFNKEFWKNAPEYVKNMKYDPKCLGDVQYVRDAKKYNL